MEYIYCKDNEEYEYMKDVLSSAGYKAEKHWRYGVLAHKHGITLYVSDDKRTIMPRVAVGFKPDGCKPSKLVRGAEVGGVFYKINDPYDSGVWKDLKTDLEPLDDTEELKADSEKLRKFAKDTKGKAKITLAPMQILTDIAEVREYGVKKYGSVDSWKEVPIEDYRDALFRHLLEYIKDPSGVDKESSIKHYKHIACNMAFICEMENMEDGTRSI
nr:MAG TPA: hypothetical protein [Caudoviricetes sp.]